MRLYTVWHPTPGLTPGENLALYCPAAGRIVNSSLELPRRCRTCLAERWHAAAFRPGERRQFVGPCGATNLCVNIGAAGLTPVSLVLQARLSERQLELLDLDSCDPRWGRPVSPDTFHHAESLLRLMVNDLETRIRARLAGHDADAAGPGAEKLARGDQSRRTESLPRLHISVTLPGPGSTGQAGHVVQAMLDYAHEHYWQPMALKEIATRLNRNANYLSALFHLVTGMCFHRYVESLRLDRAEALLTNPALRVCDAARASGYVSPNHFRAVFRSRKGLCPTAWRRKSRAARREPLGT